MFRLARLMGSCDAEAVVMTVFVEVWRRANNAPAGLSVARWIVGLTRATILAESKN